MEDNKIDIKFCKEKKTSRTYITGLEHFLNEDEIKTLITSIKKELGTSVYAKENSYGFQGEHIEKLQKILAKHPKIK